MRFYTVEKLGPTRDSTPEGYLVCRDVPIGRTGLLVYAPGEVPITAGVRGLIEIERRAEEVFRQETIDSFEAKPVCNDHPPVDITPENWQEYTVGIVLNTRRGTDDAADLLIADLLITRADAIEAVKEGKVEVSCGYDADYIETEPGRGEQRNIVGNHVALVDRGRCGPRCSIGDSKMKRKRTVWDRISTAFRNNDEEALNEALEEAQEEMSPKDEETETGTAPVTVHVHNYPDKPEVKDEKEYEPNIKDEDPESSDPMAAIAKLREEIVPVLTALAEKVAKMEAGEKAEAEANGNAADEAAPDDEEDEDEPPVTTDSGSFAADFRDAIAGAEIIAPGIKVPTFDARSADAGKSLCTFKRKALDAASKTDTGREAIAKVVPGKWNPKGMTCDAVAIAFAGVVQSVRDANNSNILRQPGGPSAGASPTNLNEVNRNFWRQYGA